MSFGILCALCSTLLGCEAFVKKFTRKPNKEKAPEEMVLQPEEYPSLFKNNQEAYQQYFLYWQSWQEELGNALLSVNSQKKQLSCIDQAIKNLTQLKTLLDEGKAAALDAYIQQSLALREDIAADIYAQNTNANRFAAEKLKRNIMRNFSYSKTKNHIL